MNQHTKPDSLELPDWTECQRISDLPDVDAALRGFAEDQTGDNATCVVRSIVRADRAARQPVAGSVDTPEFAQQMRIFLMDNVRIGPAKAINMATAIIAFVKAASPIAPAAPSGEAVAYADPMAFLNFRAAACTKEWMWAKPDAGLVPLYTRPAPRDVDAPIVLPAKPEAKMCTDLAPWDIVYLPEQMDAHATAAVLKDRANQKGTKS